MVKRRVIWTETAASQRRIILQYWTNRNKSAVFAKKLIALVADQLNLISDNPLLFSKPNLNTSTNLQWDISVCITLSIQTKLLSWRFGTIDKIQKNFLLN